MDRKNMAYILSKLYFVIYFQAFSVFFICIALTSDMICFFFIPVHWLFFAASTYVWVQYVWHTGMYNIFITKIMYITNATVNTMTN